MKRKIIFYKKETGECPTEEFLESLSQKTLLKVISVFNSIETEEVLSKKFFKRLIGTKLFEIRVKWSSNIFRFPCFFEKDSIVILTHGFQKKTMKLPRRELKKALKYYEDYVRRHNE